MESTLTYAIRLDTTDEQSLLLERTCDAYLKGCNLVSAWMWEHQTATPAKAQKALYRRLRDETGLPSQMAVSTTRRVGGNYKTIKATRGSAWKSRKGASRYTTPGYDLAYNRDYSILSDGRMSLNTLEGRVKLYADWSRIPGERRRGKYGTARILRRDRRWYILLPITLTIPEPGQPMHVAGVDRGMRFLAALQVDDRPTIFFNGKEVTQKRSQYKNRRRNLKRRHTRSARKRLKSIGGRENRWMTDTNHKVAKALVAQLPPNTIIALEDLTGIRTALVRVARSRRYEQVSWAFAQLGDFIAYKAELAGHLVAVVDPRYTSQQCPACGFVQRSNRSHARHAFACRRCGYRSNDDRAAAMNIRDLAMSLLVESTPRMPGRGGV